MPVTSDSLVGPRGIQCPVLLHKKDVFVSPPTPPEIDIIDIRKDAVELNLKESIYHMFDPEHGPRKIPTMLLYDERGLQLFEKITYLDEYYLTKHEIGILEQSVAEIAQTIPSGSMVIELGSGNLRKVILLLQAFEDARKDIDYYALDLSRQELERTLAHVPAFRYVRCHGLHGTYDDGREWLKIPTNLARHKCLLNLGSSIGNFERDEAASFLRSLSDVLCPNDTMLIGLDSCQDPRKVYHAYNDREGLTHKFVLNGLTHANRILGENVFDEAEWEVLGEYVYDREGGRHQAFYSPKYDTMVLGTMVKTHERIQVEQSLKYSQEEAKRLWDFSGLSEVRQWTTGGKDYGLHLLAKGRMPFNLLPSTYAGAPLPTLGDWRALWDMWDIVTRQMLPHSELLDKPIKLRNACIFYLGHIPAFLDIQLSKTTGGSPTEPSNYKTIFERGIDPDVDNPERCHEHSEIPEEWPPVEDILLYQGRVRSRLADLYDNGNEQIPRRVGRAVWVGFEHELMHIETLLYMMLQSDKTLPPPLAGPRPDFEKIAAEARFGRVDNQWFTLPEQVVQLGLDDPEDSEDAAGHYGWDNEKPSRQVRVGSFQAKARPITNEEYARYIYSQGISRLPASWTQTESSSESLSDGNGRPANGHSNRHGNGDSNGTDSLPVPATFLGGKAVKTVYGLVPLKDTLDWPVFASYDELHACASWMGGRIPTFEETKSIYHHVHLLKKKEAERTLGKTVPAVNGHLINNGVEETPPQSATSEASEVSWPDIFIDLDGANVGFQHWHPMPVTGNGGKLAGQSELGGVWEWTSSVLQEHEGFQPMPLYPGYTADFFDGKHNIVLGGSWATHPRIAGRKTFVNWYQRNYPYAWAGARLARDIE